MSSLVAILCALQQGNCFYCGSRFTGEPRSSRKKRQDTQWSRDHVIPLSKGGKLFVLACLKCNGEKGCKMPSAEEMRRAVILRSQVDEIGRALQSGWMSLADEKAIVRARLDEARDTRPHGFRWPREEARASPFMGDYIDDKGNANG